MKLIHYGHSKFDEQKFKPIENSLWIKPKGGLWSSPVNSSYGWKQWCLEEEFNVVHLVSSFKFKLTDNARILKVDFYKDLLALPRQVVPKTKTIRYINMFFLDFEKISQQYDVFHLTIRGLARTMFHINKPNLYGWDVETYLIMNKNCMILT